MIEVHPFIGQHSFTVPTIELETARVYLPTAGRVRLKLSYAYGIREFLRRCAVTGRSVPEFEADRKVWTVARHHFRSVVDALAHVTQSPVDVITDQVTSTFCGASCQEAISDPIECECQCVGANHGGIADSSWKTLPSGLLCKRGVYRRQFEVYSNIRGQGYIE